MYVESVLVNDGGTGYNSAPSVTFSGGGGTGASGTAKVASGSVVSINVDARGADYTSAPTVTVSGGGGTGCKATAKVK